MPTRTENPNRAQAARDAAELKLYNLKETCEILHLSHPTLRELVRSGAIKSRRIGRAQRISTEDIAEYIRSSAEAAPYPS